MDQPTPLLRWERALLKLELLSSRGSVFGRAAGAFRAGSVAASGNEALALARPGLQVALLGAVTHEMRETLKLWEVSLVAQAPPWKQEPVAYARTVGAEIASQLDDEPLRIVAPAGAAAALLGALAAVRGRWPKVRGVALLAADEELPDLPASAELPQGIEQVRVPRSAAAKARAIVARELGLLAGHAAAAAAVYAREHGGAALVTSAGEREFSLDLGAVRTAVILGMGGLGCPAALALSELQLDVELVLVDPDRVERSNLARQILFRDEDVGSPKAVVAARRLRNAEARVERFDERTGPELLRGADLLLDGTDQFATRFLANDLAVKQGVPLVHGAVLGWTGHLLIVLPGRTGCLRCLFEGPPQSGTVPTCAEAGVLSPLCGLVGATMAAAALQLLDERKMTFSRGPALEPGVLYRWDARNGTERPLALRRDPSCAACGSAASNPGRSL